MPETDREDVPLGSGLNDINVCKKTLWVELEQVLNLRNGASYSRVRLSSVE